VAERVRVLLRMPPRTSGGGGCTAGSLSGRELLASVTNTGRNLVCLLSLPQVTSRYASRGHWFVGDFGI